jgi:hypothetical protein
VPPGAEATLFFDMTAPPTPGLYNFTPNLVVQVGKPAPPPEPDPPAVSAEASSLQLAGR